MQTGKKPGAAAAAARLARMQGVRCFLCGARASAGRRLRLAIREVEGRPRLVCSRGCGESAATWPPDGATTGAAGAGLAPRSAELEAAIDALAATNPDLVEVVHRPRGRPRKMPDEHFARWYLRLAPGHTQAEMAAELRMSERTFRNYLRRLGDRR